MTIPSLSPSPRVSHWPDAAPPRQRYASEEQQPAGGGGGVGGGRHRGGGGHRGAHLHAPLLRPAEEVRLSVCPSGTQCSCPSRSFFYLFLLIDAALVNKSQKNCDCQMDSTIYI